MRRVLPRLLGTLLLASIASVAAACSSDSGSSTTEAAATAAGATPAVTEGVATEATAAATEAESATSAKQEITVTDIVGRTVTLPAPVDSMIFSEGRILYVVAMLERENPFEHVIGWADDLRVNDLDTYERYREKFPELADIPVYGSVSQNAFSAEQAIAADPDVMVLTYDSYLGAQESGLIDQLESAGIPSIVIDFRQYPLENTVPSVALMGRVLGQEERAQEFTDFYTQNVNLVYSRIAALDPEAPKPETFLYRAPGLGDCCNTFGSANMGLLIERAGGQNLGSELLPGWSGTLSPEQILTSDPDVIIVTASNWSNARPEGGWVSAGYGTSEDAAREGLQALIDATPGWGELTAAQEGRVYAVWHQFYISPYQFVPLMQFAKWQYPDAFEDIDPDAVFQEFHEQFLPIEYGGTFGVSLR